jgi:glycosyltransferase involved in cell wall biosynthesis
MNILIVNSFNKVNARLRNEISYLSDSGRNVKVILWDRSGLEEEQLTDEEKREFDIECISFEAPRASWRLIFYFPLFWLQAARYLINCTENDFDVIHCCHPGLLPFGILWSFIIGSKTVYDSFEYYAFTFCQNVPSTTGEEFIKSVVYGIENALVMMVDGVVTIDSLDDSLFKRYSSYNSNTRVLLNVPALDDVPGIKDAKDIQFDCRESCIVLIGGIDTDKGSLKALEAMRILSCRRDDISLIFIGSVRDDSENIITDYINSHNLNHFVSHVEWVPYLELLSYLDSCDVGLDLLQPTDKFRLVGKGTGRKIFTYMYCALPVIAPTFGDRAGVVRESGCGLTVDVTDPRAIAEAIEYLVDHPDEAGKMGRKGSQLLRERYNWQHEANKLEVVYQNVV